MVRAHIFYTGIVQGVGFRYTVKRLARDLSINGWVRNLSDGRVEILAEGLEENIHTFMKYIEEYFGHSLRSKQLDFVDPEEVLADNKIIATR